MISKKLGGLLMKLVLFISYYFSKKLTWVSLCHKDLGKHLLITINVKIFSEYICRQLKYHQHRIRIKTDISLLWQQHHFCLYQLSYSVNLLWCQECTFYCPLRKRRYTIIPEGTDVHIQQQIHQKDLNLCLTSYDYAKVIHLYHQRCCSNLFTKKRS